jgi:hypothetical protein
MSDLTQCAACGYITDASTDVCPRCGRPPSEPIAAPAPEPSAFAVPPSAHPMPYARPGPPPATRRSSPVALVSALLVLATAAVLVAFYVFFIRPENAKLAKAEDLKAVLRQQPDFVADCEGVEGDFSYTGRMARKGDRFLFLIDIPRAILLGDPSRTGNTPITALITPNPSIQIVVPELRAYLEIPRGTKNMPKNDPIRDILSVIEEQKCDVRDFGASSVGPYETRLFCVSAPDGSRRDAYVEVAPALGNLIVKLDFNDDWTTYDGQLKYTLSNVKTEVDEDLFRVPTTYTKITR